jgi:hypothetical protein
MKIGEMVPMGRGCRRPLPTRNTPPRTIIASLEVHHSMRRWWSIASTMAATVTSTIRIAPTPSGRFISLVQSRVTSFVSTIIIATHGTEPDQVGAGRPTTLSRFFSRPIPFFFLSSSPFLKMRSWMVRFLPAREQRMRSFPTLLGSIRATALVYATMSSFSMRLLCHKNDQVDCFL